jgi:hypothetical protein
MERVSLGLQEPELEDQRVLVNPESLTELLRTPALRSVTFDCFRFTNALCHATANALEEGSPVTDITFESCLFPDGGAAIKAAPLIDQAEAPIPPETGGNDANINRTDAACREAAKRTFRLDLTIEELNLVKKLRLEKHLTTADEAAKKTTSPDISVCHATANSLEEGSSVTGITFECDCSFPDGGAAIIANALKTNASVTAINFCSPVAEPFFNNLAAVLLCNSTLQYLTVYAERTARGRCLSSLFLSLQINTTLNSLSLNICDEFGDELCAAIRSGLAKNSTLEELALDDMVPSDDDGAVSARNALSFLRTNYTLKALKVSFQLFVQAQMELYISAFRLEAVKLMEESCFIESLTIEGSSSGIKVEELFALISALQLNTTLKTLGYQFSYMIHYLTDDEVNQLVLLLMKNYGLERLVPDIACEDDRTIKVILRLNGAGRRYLIEDGSSISKGVEVLSAVNDDINCVFLHLLENPGLCNRRAIETTTTRSRRPVANLLRENRNTSC